MKRLWRTRTDIENFAGVLESRFTFLCECKQTFLCRQTAQRKRLLELKTNRICQQIFMKDTRRVKIEDSDWFNMSLCLDIKDHDDAKQTHKNRLNHVWSVNFKKTSPPSPKLQCSGISWLFKITLATKPIFKTFTTESKEQTFNNDVCVKVKLST